MQTPYQFRKEDAFEFAKMMRINTRPHGDELYFQYCPYCKGGQSKDRDTFSINLKTGQFKCLRSSCNARGNMISLSKDFDYSLGREVDEYFRPRRQFKQLPQPDKKIIPKPEAIEYLKGRGISEEVIEKYQITVQTKNPNILVLPHFDEKGILQCVKYRKTDFDKARDKNKEWFEQGTKPILFGMNQCEDRGILVVTEGQCFDKDAEVFTKGGWVKLSDYSGQYVMQVNEDLTGTFVRPKQYIVKRYTGKMLKVSIGGNYYTCITPDHNLVFRKPDGVLTKIRADENPYTTWSIPTAINFSSEEKKWTNDEIALVLATSADGTLDYRTGRSYRKPKSMVYARFAFKKERKAQRLREILTRLGIDFSDSIEKRGYASICFSCPEWLDSKYLPWSFVTGTTLEQKKFILEEMVHWDGNHVNNRNQYEYVSIIKHNIDVMQAVASTCGYMSTIIDRKNGSNQRFSDNFIYKLSILFGKNNVSAQSFFDKREFVDADTRVFCLTVPSGMLLVRQQNKISVSGNCDALSVATAGIKNAVSVPNGCKSFTFIPYCWDWINEFEEIVIFGDNENGHITLAEDFKQRFDMKIRIVKQESYRGCKDANELLQKFGAEAVKEAVENAEFPPVKHTRNLGEVEYIDVFKVKKVATGLTNLDRLLYGGLPLGGITLITAKPGRGKSCLASQILINAASQGFKCFAYSGELPNGLFRSWMDFQVAGPDHVFAYENIWGDTNYGISETNRKLISEWYKGKIEIYDDRALGEEDEQSYLVKIIEMEIMRNGCNVILIDNLMTAMDLEARVGDDKYERQSLFMKKLAAIARKRNVLIILVAHKRKNNFTTDANDEISGSGDIANLATLTLAYDDAQDIEEDQRRLSVAKNRLFGKTKKGGWVLNYDEKSKRIYETEKELHVDFHWGQEDGFYDAEGGDLVFA